MAKPLLTLGIVTDQKEMDKAVKVDDKQVLNMFQFGSPRMLEELQKYPERNLYVRIDETKVIATTFEKLDMCMRLVKNPPTRPGYVDRARQNLRKVGWNADGLYLIETTPEEKIASLSRQEAIKGLAAAQHKKAYRKHWKLDDKTHEQRMTLMKTMQSPVV